MAQDMAHYDATIPSSWTPQQTFDYMADFRHVAEWDPSIPEVTLVEGVPGEHGTTYEVWLEVLGRKTPLLYTCVEHRRPERLVFRAETDHVTSTDTITVGIGPEGTTVTYDAQLDLHGVRKLADPVAGIALTRASDRAKAGLEVKLAS